VLKLAVSEIPRDKIILGVPTYGYDWNGSQPARDVQWTEAEAIAQAHAAPVMWDPTAQSPWFAYTDSQGHPHTVWFEDARSLSAKLALAATYRVNGVAIWRLGGEDPAIWEQLRQAT
jgi:spore germination protein YaaH